LIKWVIISPVLLFYLLRDMAMLLTHHDLMRGMTILILISLLGIFFTAWLQGAKREDRVKRRLGDETYEWIERLND
jgi:hypothetical protein